MFVGVLKKGIGEEEEKEEGESLGAVPDAQ